MRRKKISAKLFVLLVLTGLLIVTAVFSKWLCPYDPNEQNLSLSLMAPCKEHWMGTDLYGRDMFSRVIAGAHVSILSTLVLVLFSSITGTLLGLVSGYLGGKIDAILMRITDLFLAFPGMVLALAAAALFNNGIVSAVGALALVSWPKYARLARSSVLSLKEKPYIDAAKLAGDTPMQIIVRHVLPNAVGMLLVTAVLDFGTMMMEIAGFSFLGLGAQPPLAEWGSMMSEARGMLLTYPWVPIAPGIAIFLCAAIFNLLGDSLRDYLDPHMEEER